ncbi:MAG: TetR/AcrR family transcriptional regulator [Hyphomicrobiaceae bacterium]
MARAAAKVVALKSNAKVSREDWLTHALDALVSDGVEEVKILPLAERLGVSRSSFYWYFKSRKALLDALIAHWQATNTEAILAAADEPALTVTGAVSNLFACFIDAERFDPQLDFAVREWSRRSGPVRRVVDIADAARLEAITRMFARYDTHGIEPGIRARILYYMQIGYYALELNEPLDERIGRVAAYLEGFTGQKPSAEEVEKLVRFSRRGASGS